MKKILSLLAMTLILPLSMLADENAITMSVTNVSETQWLVSVQLTNPNTTFAGFQLDVQAPEGTSFDESTLTASDRLYKVLPQANMQPSGWLRIVGYSSTRLAKITGNEGEIFSIVLNSTEPLEQGSYDITAKNIRISTSAGKETLIPGFICTFEVAESELFPLIFWNENSIYYSTKLAAGDSIKCPDEPAAKEGYTFCGWGDVPAVMPASNLELYAVWCPIHYNVIYKSEGVAIDTVQVAYGSALPDFKPEPIEGHTFCGWSNAPEKMPAHDITLEATWCVISYDVIYIVEGREVKRESVPYGSELPVFKPDNIPGYKFAGWIDAPETMPACDIELEASWTPNKHAVNYYVDNELVHTDTVEYNSPFELYEYEVENPVKYAFRGWTGDTYETMPDNDIEYYATLWLRGDVNVDGKINAADVVSIYNYILVGDASNILRINANVNEDQYINSADVVTVYNIIIGQ